jgi:hypothetical protein
MKETCRECRYCGMARIKGTGQTVDTWCYMKDKIAPKNTCKFWRPRRKAQEDKQC